MPVLFLDTKNFAWVILHPIFTPDHLSLCPKHMKNNGKVPTYPSWLWISPTIDLMSKFKEFCVSTDVPSFLRMKQTETLHLDIYLFLSLLLILLVVESAFPLLQFPHTSLNSVKFSNAFETVCFLYSHYQPYWESWATNSKILKYEHNLLQSLT